MRKQKMQVKRRLPRGPEGPAARGGQRRPGGGCPETDNDPRPPPPPPDNKEGEKRGAEETSLQQGFPGTRLHRQSPAAGPGPAPACHHRPEPGRRGRARTTGIAMMARAAVPCRASPRRVGSGRVGPRLPGRCPTTTAEP